nr:hypothetical protein [Treponema socranskii]
MKTKIIKTTVAAGIAALLLAGSVFADSHKSNSKKPPRGDEFERREIQGDTDALMHGERRMKRGGAAGPMQNSVMGDWIVRDTDKIVKAEFDRDGTMEITWKQGFASEIEWKGYWTATDSEITFTVKSKETETWTNGKKKEMRESMNEVWKITYTRDGDTLTLTSSDLPKEVAGGTVYTWEY